VTFPRHLSGTTLAAMALAVAAVFSSAAVAADDQGGPVIVGNPNQSAPVFNMDLPKATLNLDYANEHDTSRQDGVTTGTTNNQSTEDLDVETKAYILSPKFFDMSLGGTFGLEQTSFDDAGQNRYTAGLLDGWDVSGTLLRDQGAPLTLYSRQSEEFITPDFSPSLNSTDRATGANLAIRSETAPTQFQIYQQEDTQSEIGGETNYSSNEDVFHWHTEVINLPHQTLTWDYSYHNTLSQESESPSIRDENHSASLNHALYFGTQQQSSLSSSLSADVQTGELAYDDLRLDEALRLWHSKDFQTHFEYSLDRSEMSGVTQTSNSLDAGLVHQLFGSLTTTADVGGSLLNASGTQVEQLFGTLDFGYRKTVPDGLLLFNLNGGWQWQYAPRGTATTSVINQAETFTDTQPIILTQPNIDPNSIVVVSPAGVPYLKGSDFTVNTVGSLIQIQRVIGGLIPPDGGVMLDYKVLAQPASTINTGTYGIGGRYDIDKGFLTGLSPYARYSVQDQSIDTEVPSAFIPDSFNDIVAGSDYRIWLITFNAEEQWHDSTLIPYDATRFSVRYSQALGRDTTAGINASYSMINYYDERDRVNDASIGASIRRNLNSEWSIEARAQWMNDRDELFGDTDGLEEQLELRWKHNQTEIFGRVRNATISNRDVDSTFQVFEVGLSRSF
jgi:hypothetical protein